MEGAARCSGTRPQAPADAAYRAPIGTWPRTGGSRRARQDMAVFAGLADHYHAKGSAFRRSAALAPRRERRDVVAEEGPTDPYNLVVI